MLQFFEATINLPLMGVLYILSNTLYDLSGSVMLGSNFYISYF